MLNKKGSAGYWVVGVIVVVLAIVAYFTFGSSSQSNFSESNVSNDVVLGNSYTVQEVAQHSSQQDCWVIVNGKVYDATQIIPTHPGGAQAIVPLCGKDGSVAFNTKNGKGSHSPKASETLDSYFVGNFKS